MIVVGQTVGNYNIISKLGEGGMGTVFLAEHPVIGRKVALKAIHPQFARSADVISRFVTEAKSVNQIGHQHIVDVTDFGSTPEGDFYFIMEYLLGDNLADAIRREGRFPTERALRIGAQIADALHASHGHGVVHRDLKPENIILIPRPDDEDFVKVLDFGLAKLTTPGHVPGHNTRTGSVMGTPYYMAPEQCEGRVEIDHRADIYALGVILFEMLTGKLPFGGGGYGEIIMKHMTTPSPSARSIVPDLSPALDLILFRALGKEPRDRFQTMAELRQALLDPEYYASSMPASLVDADLSLRVRAAMPMARTEMKLAPVDDMARAPASELEALDRKVSTFSQSLGQVSEVDLGALRPKRSRGGAVMLAMAGLVALTAGGVRYRHEAERLVATALAPKGPTTVRLNFSSDPDGATVTRADGTVLGMTPLSTDVPFGDTGLEYVLRKKGYLPKTLAVIPNLAAPLFAALEREPTLAPVIQPLVVPAAPTEDAPEAPAGALAEAGASRPLTPAPSLTVRPRRHRARPAQEAAVAPEPGRDDSMPQTPSPDPQTAP